MKSRVFLAAIGVLGSAIAVGQLTASHESSSLAFESEELNPQGGDVYDVRPCIIGSLRQFGTMGTYPTGTTALALSTTGQNVGNVQLPWYQSTQVHHPVIGMNMYMVDANGTFKQIGESWLKHAWFAVQGSNCGSCNSSGTGTRLGVGCADTYGASLNADQYWLGPRWEISPNEQIWMDGQTWAGSHFARNGDTGDSSSHNSVQHRLRVRMGDLTEDGADYYYEGVYWLNKKITDSNWVDLDELAENMFNNARHNKVQPNRDGNSFTFTNIGTHVDGPAMAQWGDSGFRGRMADTGTSPEDDGVIYVSSRAVDLGGGQHRYEYAVMNMSVSREVDSFAVPVSGVTVSDFGFHGPKDGYWDAGGNFVNEAISHDGVYQYDFQDWTASNNGGMLTFTPPTPGGNTSPNTLRYGVVYTFWFTANSAPVQGGALASMTPHKAGVIQEYTATVQAPESVADPATLDSVTVVVGTLNSGTVADLTTSDDQYVNTTSGYGNNLIELHNMTMIVDATTSSVTPSSLTVNIEQRIDQSSGFGVVWLKNWNTGQYVNVGQFAIGNTDGTDTIAGIDATNYVGANGEISLQLQQRVFVPQFAFNFDGNIDMVEILVTP